MKGSEDRVLVIGGGVIGAACAHYLNRAGLRVTVVDRAGMGEGCSHANCGYISPSHILPLATPSALAPAFRSLLTPNSPFRIKPRFDPALWNWLFRFARRCNKRDMLESGHGIDALLRSSRALYDDLMKEGIQCEFEAKGMIFVLRSAARMEHFAEMDHMLREEFGLGAERIDGEALNRMEPALLPGLAGGWYYPNDAHLRPDSLMTSWQHSLQERGVEVREKCSITHIRREGRKAIAAVTADGEIQADFFIFATGAWTPLMNSSLGFRVPIQPGKGYSITMARPAICPVYPMLFEEHRVGVTPMQSAYRLGSTMEFAGYDTTMNQRRLALLRDGAKHYLHQPLGERVIEEWFGWRPMTYDSRPIIGAAPIADNLFIAAGHNMLGLSMAPGTGKLVAELVTGVTPHVDPAPYSPQRFVR